MTVVFNHKQKHALPERVEEPLPAEDVEYLSHSLVDEGLVMYCNMFVVLLGSKSKLLDTCRRSDVVIDTMPKGWEHYGGRWFCDRCMEYIHKRFPEETVDIGDLLK